MCANTKGGIVLLLSNKGGMVLLVNNKGGKGAVREQQGRARQLLVNNKGGNHGPAQNLDLGPGS